MRKHRRDVPCFFKITTELRKSFPSETQVRRGDRVVPGDVAPAEKPGRNDLSPCGSGRRFFKNCCKASGRWDGSYYFQGISDGRVAVANRFACDSRLIYLCPSAPARRANGHTL